MPRSFIMAPVLALACALLVLPFAQGLTVPLHADFNSPLDAATLSASCIGQGARNVCYPLPSDGREYVECGTSPAVRSCPSGTRFDYVRRRCLRASSALRCPYWKCPAGHSPAVSRPYGTFGQPGNLTIPLYKKESFTVVCPVQGHCMGGMMFDVYVECPAPQDRTPYTFEVDWEETVTNSMLYPKRQPDMLAFCGDKVLVKWVEPFHLVQLFNTSKDAQSLWEGTLVNPFPPQPVYQCPDWPVGPRGMAMPLPGDQSILPAMSGAQNTTWTANMTETFFFACPVGNHCRLGQVFKVTVTDRPAGAGGPTLYRLIWTLSSDNYEDMHIYVGDSIFFQVPANPPQAHGLVKVPASRIMTLA